MQEYLVKYIQNNTEHKFYYFSHSFKTARQLAMESIENKITKYGKIELYRINNSQFGNQWILEKTYTKKDFIIDR